MRRKWLCTDVVFTSVDVIRDAKICKIHSDHQQCQMALDVSTEAPNLFFVGTVKQRIREEKGTACLDKILLMFLNASELLDFGHDTKSVAQS